MAGLILRKEEFFPSATQAVAVADRYPQNVFAEHTHEFCELVLVWRGNGLGECLIGLVWNLGMTASRIWLIVVILATCAVSVWLGLRNEKE